MPIYFPPGNSPPINLFRLLFSSAYGTGTVSVTQAFFSPTFGKYIFVLAGGNGVLTADDLTGPYDFSSTGISASGSLCTGFNFQSRVYRVRLGNTVATAVRATNDLVNWVTEFGGIIINDAVANEIEGKVLLATNYVAGGPNNAVLYTGTTWDLIYSGNAVNALRALVTSTGRLLLGFGGGILRHSDNDGASWTEVNLGEASNCNRLWQLNDDTILCALANGAIYESTDDGDSFASGFPANNQLRPATVNFFSGRDEVFAYGNGGLLAKRTAPLVWTPEPSPNVANFIGSFDGDTPIGFVTDAMVSKL